MMFLIELGGLQEVGSSIMWGPIKRRLSSEGSANKLLQLVAIPVQPPGLNIVHRKAGSRGDCSSNTLVPNFVGHILLGQCCA